MSELHKKYRVIIASSRPREAEKATERWLRRNRIRYHGYLNTRETGKDKIGLDLLIDDNPENVKGFVSAGGIAILFDQPWNRVVDEEFKRMESEGKIIRVKKWEEIPHLVDKLLTT